MEAKWKINNRSLVLGTLVFCTLMILSPVFEPASAYRASNYAVNDAGIYTYPYIQQAAQKQTSMGYSASTFIGVDANYAFNRLPSDQVFYFNGHGGPGLIDFGTTCLYASTSAANSISDFTSGQLNDLALAVFVSCNSGLTHSGGLGNLLTESTLRGTDCALGFINQIESNKAGYWSDNFWGQLDQGETVAEGAAEALQYTRMHYLWQTGGVESYTIQGNANLIIDPAVAGV